MEREWGERERKQKEQRKEDSVCVCEKEEKITREEGREQRERKERKREREREKEMHLNTDLFGQPAFPMDKTGSDGAGAAEEGACVFPWRIGATARVPAFWGGTVCEGDEADDEDEEDAVTALRILFERQNG